MQVMYVCVRETETKREREREGDHTCVLGILDREKDRLIG